MRGRSAVRKNRRKNPGGFATAPGVYGIFGNVTPFPTQDDEKSGHTASGRWVPDVVLSAFVLIEHWEAGNENDKIDFNLPYNPVTILISEFFKFWALENGGFDPINGASADFYDLFGKSGWAPIHFWRRWRILQSNLLIIDLSLRTIFPIRNTSQYSKEDQDVGFLLLVLSYFVAGVLIIVGPLLPILKGRNTSGVIATTSLIGSINNFIASARFKKLFTESQAAVLAGLGSISTELGKVKEQVETIDSKVDVVDTVVDSIDVKVDIVDTVVDSINTSLGIVDGKIDSVILDLADLATSVSDVNTKAINIQTSINSVQTDVTAIGIDVTSANSSLAIIDTNVDDVKLIVTDIQSDLVLTDADVILIRRLLLIAQT